jgi:hypothetical protein
VAALHNPSEYDQAGGHPLRRFLFRALVGVFGPLVVIGYFVAVWYFYLKDAKPDDPVAFGPIGAKWIFYSWFVAGVIGLNLSLYGLEGVEAAMLMEPGWNVGNGMKLMMHADKTWSGPGGWMKTVKWIWQMSKRNGQLRLPSMLWFILAVPSILVFIAYPLSGLTMEMTQGYLRGTIVDGGPTMTGFSYNNFNERNGQDAMDGARVTWENALEARIPGHGAMYTEKGYDRSQDDYLSDLPTKLPKNDGLSGVFLTAQAESPIEGNSWGLLLQYNCSIIDDINDFQILSQRNGSKTKFSPSSGLISYQVNNGSATITGKNQTTGTIWASNLNAVMEMGYEEWPSRSTMLRLMAEDYRISSTLNPGCYYNKLENKTGDYPGYEQSQVFEVMLWQDLGVMTRIGQQPKYNFSLDHNITGAYASDWRNFFNEAPSIAPANSSVKNSTQFRPVPMSAIGVQCKASSSVGTADIDGITSTWSNFIRTDTPLNIQRSRCANRFTGDTPNMVMREVGKDDWLPKLFTSVAAPPPFYLTQSIDPDDIDIGTGINVQLQYLQAKQLRESMLRAYAAYAVQLMYNGGQGFTTVDGSRIEIQNPNVTEFVLGTVITRGVVPAEVPIVLFAAWAIVGSILGVIYGFRRRWSAMLDGYTMFRLGADLPDDVKRRFADQSVTLEVEDCRGLDGVPALVGDMKPEMWLGRIGLVGKGGVAVKSKLYE